MVRLDRTTFALIVLLLSSTVANAQTKDQAWSLRFDLASPAATTNLTSWVDGSVGKLRYDEQDSSLGIGRMAFVYDGRVVPKVAAHVVADYVDDASRGLDVTEAYLEWRPVPRSANRQRVRFGAFFPPLSLENGGPGWTNPYTISSSAINTWIGEEVRTIGAEWSLSRPLGPRAAGREMKWLAAFYYGNDPAGVLLAWKGWSLHDRQSRLGDALPLPDLPQLAPGMMFASQADQQEPFRETDDRPGFYFGTEWRLSRRVLVSAMHYDNHADPTSLRDGNYGWTTRFDHIGVQLDLPAELGLVAQWMRGSTAMGPVVGGAHVVDASFQSYFVLLTRAFDRHRVSLRFDDFEVGDRDTTPLDANDESGDAWTLAYRFDFSDKLGVSLEWLRITTDRSSWAYFGLPTHASERLIDARVTYRLQSARN